MRGYAVLIGLASLALLAVSWVQAQGPRGERLPRLLGRRQGGARRPPRSGLRPPLAEQVQTGAGFTGWYAFVNPPPFLFVTTPFGALPVPLAWIAWVAVTYAAWAWVSVRAFPRLWPLVLVFPER